MERALIRREKYDLPMVGRQMQKAAMYVKYADTRQDAMSGWDKVFPSDHLRTRTDNDEKKKKKSLSELSIDSTDW